MIGLPKTLQDQNGQILVGFLLVMVLGMTITLSLVSRTTTDQRTTTTTEQSSRAYSAAEAGVEDVLKKIENNEVAITNVPVTGSGNLNGATNYSYSAVKIGSSTKTFVYPNPLIADDVTQVWLADYQTLNPIYTSPRIRIFWGNPGTAANSATTPGLEITLVYKMTRVSPALNKYESQKWFYWPNTSGTQPTGFNSPTQISTAGVLVPGANNNLGVDTSFAFSINEPGSDGGSDGIYLNKIKTDGTITYSPLMLRVRMLYNSSVTHILAVQPLDVNPSSNLPDQGYEVTSTGSSTTGSTRKVKVFRSFPYLGNIFDFALFSGNTKRALKK